MITPIVSAKWLKERIADPELVILDASQTRSTVAIANEDLQLVGARFFDLKNVFSRQDTDLPNMLPTAQQFERACRNIGINKTSKIVVYDNLGVYYSPRVWFMFKTMGHQQVFVLDGGLPNWIANEYTAENKVVKQCETGDFCAFYNPNNIKSFENIKDNITKQDAILIDARSTGRFNGLAPEPRKGLRSGAIKNSKNLPFNAVLENGKFKSKKELTTLFKSLHLGNYPLIFSCGSGVTACIVLLACQLVLKNETSIYDGSWTEWATRTQDSVK